MNKQEYDNYLNILRGELIPAMGCTEPIAIAYAAAKARQLLGAMPERMVARCSGNIIKNVKGVNVPNAGGQKGVEVAAILGALAGDPELELQVISKVTPEAVEQVRRLNAQKLCTCELQEGVENLFIRIEAAAGTDRVLVELKTRHNHISYLEKNGQVLLDADDIQTAECGDKSQLNIRDIIAFADAVALSDVEELIDLQIQYNNAISAEGLQREYGACVGKTLLELSPEDLRTQAIARAAAGSDARMNGCALPVVINSGSGNQGMTASLPVIEYAKELGSSQEELYRALLLSNLITLHQKTGIGRLSAYCGAVSAGAAAGAGIAFLHGADLDTVSQTVVNALAVTSGIICDGAKASCAGKIAAAVDAGILGFEMCRRSFRFLGGDGILRDDPEGTIQNVGRLGRIGMRETDQEIIKMMTEY